MSETIERHRESAAWFRARLREVDIGDRGLAQRLIIAGDDREPADILNSIRQMANGEVKVTGEMCALLHSIGEGAQTEECLVYARLEINRLADLLRGLGYERAIGRQ
jgi:hypothetical protein